MSARDFLMAAGGASGVSGGTSNTFADVSTTGSTSTTCAWTVPTHSAGQMLVAVITGNATQSGTWTVPGGWTKTVDGGAPGTLIAWKLASGSEPVDYTFTYSRSAIFAVARLVYAGGAYIELFDRRATAGGNQSTATIPEQTQEVRDDKVLAIFTLSGTNTLNPDAGTSSSYVTLTNGTTGPTQRIFEYTRSAATVPAATVTYGSSVNNSNDQTSVSIVDADAVIFSSYSQSAEVEYGAQTTSASFTVLLGSGTATTSGCDFQVNGAGGYVTSASVSAGDSIELRQTLSAWDTPTDRTFTLGAKTHTWTVTATSVRLFTTAGTQSFVVPSGVTSLSILCIGGGGGGGGVATTGFAGGGGGGAGALSYTNNVPVTAGETLTVVVGATGARGLSTLTGEDPSSTTGTTSHTDGGAGGLSRVHRAGTTLVSANGGSGGPKAASAAQVAGGAGGTTGGTGTVKRSGGAGGGSGSNGSFSAPGWGGHAATPAANGGIGYTGTDAISNGYNFAKVGESGDGTMVGSTSWTVNAGLVPAASYPNGTLASSEGLPHGAGGGGGTKTNVPTYYNGRAGGPGACVIIMNGRTFSSATMY